MKATRTLVIFCTCLCFLVSQAQVIVSPADEERAKQLFQEGVAASQKKNYPEAIAKFTDAIRIKPDYFLAYGYRGRVKCEAGNYYDAIDDFDAALKINPRYAYALNNRGYVLLMFRCFNKAAEADFDSAIRLKPDFAEAYYNRGIAREMLRDPSGACSDWYQAKKLGMEVPDNFLVDCDSKNELENITAKDHEK